MLYVRNYSYRSCRSDNSKPQQEAFLRCRVGKHHIHTAIRLAVTKAQQSFISTVWAEVFLFLYLALCTIPVKDATVAIQQCDGQGINKIEYMFSVRACSRCIDWKCMYVSRGNSSIMWLYYAAGVSLCK